MTLDDSVAAPPPVWAPPTPVMPPPPPAAPPPDIGTVAITIDCIDTFYYAVAHRPVVRSLTLTNQSVDPGAGDLVVRISVEGATTDPLLHEHTFEIPALAIGDEKSLRTIRLTPNHKQLALLAEQLTANLVVNVSANGIPVGVARQPINFLAYNQWMHRPEFVDSFAAFVLPNHPAISPVLERARGLLGERTGQPMTEGYQSGDPARVAEIAKAVFDALAEQRLQYTDPPASFEGFGQKIRTPDIVFEDRCATCLDSTVLYASCLAAAGLDPVLLLSRGHAFAGYWTHNNTAAGPAAPGADARTADLAELMRRPVVDNRNDIATLFAAGALAVVETTFMTVADTLRTFEEAAHANASFFTDRLSELTALVNVGAARAAGVRPVAARRFVNGVVEISFEPAARQPAAVAAATPNAAAAAAPAARMQAFDAPPRIRSWLNSLLDLSFSNPLINLRPGRGGAFAFDLAPGMLAAVENRLLAGSGIELLSAARAPGRVIDAEAQGPAIAAEFADSGRLYSPAIASVEPMIDATKRIALEQHPTLTDAQARRAAEEAVAAKLMADLESSISALKRKAREIESQAGSNNLFLTIGSLRWTEPPAPGVRVRDGLATAPLFLIPVRITGTAATALRITIDDGAEVIPNYCLLEKLRVTFDLHIPALETPDLDDAGIDVDATIAAVRTALSNKRLNDVFVEETAHLAVLNFATFRLWKDMRDHWQTFIGNPVVRHLVERPYEAFTESQPNAAAPSVAVPAAPLLCPIEIDESQLHAVEWAVAGRSFVIEGPPGTGKSQTITNLLAACIAANKRVLFVAQKQPALQVVKKRLEQIGLTPFCIDLHDKGSKPEQIRKQVRDALDFAGVDRAAEWTELTARLLADDQALTAYRDVIHTKNAIGYSAWSARRELSDIGPGAAAPIPPAFLTTGAASLPAIRDALLALPTIAGAGPMEPAAPWSLSDQSDFARIDQAQLADTVARLAATLAELERVPPAVKQALARIDGPGGFATVIATVDIALTVGLPTDAELATIGTPAWIAERDALAHRLANFASTAAPLRAAFNDMVFSIDTRPLLAAATEAATAGFLSKGKKQRALELMIAPIRNTGFGDPDAADVVRLLQMAEPARAELAGVAAALRALPGMRLPPSWSALSATDVPLATARLSAIAGEAALVRAGAPAGIRTALAGGWMPTAPTMAALSNAQQLWASFGDALAVTAESRQRWRGGRGFVEAWAATGAAWQAAAPRFLTLQRWCDVVAALRPIRAAGLIAFEEHLLGGAGELGEAYDEFRRGVIQTALAERLEAGRVDQFDGLAHDRRVQSFVARSGQRRQLMRSVIPAQLVQQRPFTPGARFGEYGALERELGKTTRRLSIRKLVERYGEILPNLTPCFLMSPDSVARFLPPGAITFDLVVFDEASQIEVAEAIGAMGRARAVVVVGDSKQMPPSKFGGSSAATELDSDFAVDDDAVFEDLESILSECVESNLPRVYLQCHYRSRHEALIAFSNAAFYEGKLTTFPSPNTDGPPPIHWRRTEGQFDRSGTADTFRTNRHEADAIVADVLRRLDDPTRVAESICIVTLNIQQQTLIIRLLEETDDARIRALLEDETDSGLIVRNLESVQGDERDVVLISVAFSPIVRTLANGQESRRLPLNFGPLNRKGGERRLNVAVTRARREVTVFCSFEPDEMRLTENPAKGLELLKQYLSIAREGATVSGDLTAREPSAPDPHRAEIAAALRERGVRVRENVGLSKFRIDLTVGAPDRTDWQVAVLLDGPDWAARATAYDRDALPPNVLAMMGWPRVVRVWLPSWIQEPTRVIDEIVAAVAAADTPAALPPPPPPPPNSGPPPPTGESAAPSAPSAPTVAAGTSTPTGTIVPPPPPPIATLQSAARTIRREREFTPAPTSAIGDKTVLDRLDEASAVALVTAAITDTLTTEAPVHTARLAKVVATRFGFDRVTQRRVDDILALATTSYSRRSEFGVFLWHPDAEPDQWLDYRRTPAGVERKLEHIAPEEIRNAITDIVDMGGVIETDELLRVTAEIFGARKITTPVRTHLAAVLSWSIATGHLVVDASSRVRLP